MKWEPYNEKTDIWALGCVLFELCCIKRAFEDKNEEAIKQQILTFAIPQIPLHTLETRPGLSELGKIY